MSRALVLQHGNLGPPGLLGEWLAERGIELQVHRLDEVGEVPDVRDFGMVACLGSRFNPSDTEEPSVVAARATLERAVEHDVPVLGLCFGGQLLASVLGGQTLTLEAPELGWHEIESTDADIAGGPWLQWHWHGFTTPPGATELARSAACAQAFRQGPHLGVQFHPESTVEIVARWADSDTPRLVAEGVPDGHALLVRPQADQDAAAANARRLFDGFWDAR